MNYFKDIFGSKAMDVLKQSISNEDYCGFDIESIS